MYQYPKHTVRSAWIPAVALVCTACGGGPDGTITTSNPPPPVPLVRTGVFKDSNVAGLDFVSGAESGVTDAAGRFTCETASDVTFSIGRVTLGSAQCATLVHPAALAASGTLIDPEALDITRFLLLLDQDADPDNGIVISDALRISADNWSAIRFGTPDFEPDLSRVLADIAAVDGRTPILPTTAEAFAHLDETLICAFSGAFIGSLPASSLADVGNAAVLIYRDPATGRDLFELMGWRSGQRLLFLTSRGEVELATRPTLGSFPVPGFADVDGLYTTPDDIQLGWVNSGSSIALNRAGTIRAMRIGGDTGSHRFVGTLFGTQGGGVVALTLDGDALDGEAYLVTPGIRLQVKGSVAADGTSVDILVDGEVAAASLTRDAAGEPIAIDGVWPGTAPGSFEVFGCRLN